MKAMQKSMALMDCINNKTNNISGSALETMEDKQAFLSAIIESSDDAIISKNLDGIITSWNRGAERIFGYHETEMIGQPIMVLIPEERQGEEEHILGQIRKGKQVEHFQTFRLSKTGQQIPISLTVSPIKDAKGHIIGASKIARDISAEIKAQHEVSQLLNELKTAVIRKDEFIALVSHELKTPLTSISGYLQIIGKKTEEPFTEKFVHKTLDQVEKLNKLVSELLDITRIGAGKLQLHMETFDFGQLVSETIDTFQYTFPSHALHFEGPETGIFVYADKQRIEQVLLNLLSNAVKYSPFSKVIWVRLYNNGQSITFSVRDEGIGLTADQQQLLFTRFYRAEGVEKIQGLGLGLYLCKEIVERHGGRIDVKSEAGQGSEFYFVLPLAE